VFFNLISVHKFFLAPIQVNKLYVNSVLLKCETLPIFCQPSIWVIQAFLADTPFPFPRCEERFKIRTTGRDCNCSLHSSRGYFQVNKFRNTWVFAIIRGTEDCLDLGTDLSASLEFRQYSVNLDYALNWRPSSREPSLTL